MLSPQQRPQSFLKHIFSGPRHVDRLVITEKERLEATPVAIGRLCPRPSSSRRQPERTMAQRSPHWSPIVVGRVDEPATGAAVSVECSSEVLHGGNASEAWDGYDAYSAEPPMGERRGAILRHA